MSKLKTGDRIEIRWDDAFSGSSPYWRTMADAASDGESIKRFHTIGYFLCQTDRYLTVAQSIGHGLEDEHDQYGDVFNIPSGFIHSVRKLKGIK